MQSIQDIIDTELSLGFSYFYGLEDDQGYLRRLLRTNPSLESIYAQLKDDINLIDDADEDYFKTKTQLKAFKSLKKYLKMAKKYIKTQLINKKKKSKSEEDEIKKEIKDLQKDLRNGYIDKEEYDRAERILLVPVSDNLSEVKSKFEEIDSQVKRELKQVGYEEEPLDFDEEDDVVWDIEANESIETNPDKKVDEGNRRYSMREFNELYEAILNPKQQDANQQKQALAISTMVKQYEQQKKAVGKNPQQTASLKKNNAAKLQQLGVDPKLIAQLQADDKL